MTEKYLKHVEDCDRCQKAQECNFDIEEISDLFGFTK